MSSVDRTFTEEEAAKLKQLRASSGASADIPDHVLLRYLVARNWIVDDALRQYSQSAAWRKKYGVDALSRGAHGPIGVDAQAWACSVPDPQLTSKGVELYPQFRLMDMQQQAASTLGERTEGAWLYLGAPTLAFGHDKKGRPIHLQRAGLAARRFPEACRLFNEHGAGWESEFRMRNIFFMELQLQRMAEATRRFGRLITQEVVVMDAREISYRPDGRAFAAFRELITIMTAHYPETLHKFFIINAPAFFKARARPPARRQHRARCGTPLSLPRTGRVTARRSCAPHRPVLTAAARACARRAHRASG
jgi:hypothetical protein